MRHRSQYGVHYYCTVQSTVNCTWLIVSVMKFWGLGAFLVDKGGTVLFKENTRRIRQGRYTVLLKENTSAHNALCSEARETMCEIVVIMTFDSHAESERRH